LNFTIHLQTDNQYKIRRRKVKKKLSEGARSKTKKVQFNLFAPEAKRVFLVGGFNNWDGDNLLMKRDKKGTWKANFTQPPGSYEYCFRVDGVWHDDPNAHERVETLFLGRFHFLLWTLGFSKLENYYLSIILSDFSSDKG
jgi:1,4-alpha-glucan branching enzyme